MEGKKRQKLKEDRHREPKRKVETKRGGGRASEAGERGGRGEDRSHNEVEGEQECPCTPSPQPAAC